MSQSRQLAAIMPAGRFTDILLSIGLLTIVVNLRIK